MSVVALEVSANRFSICEAGIFRIQMRCICWIRQRAGYYENWLGDFLCEMPYDGWEHGNPEHHVSFLSGETQTEVARNRHFTGRFPDWKKCDFTGAGHLPICITIPRAILYVRRGSLGISTKIPCQTHYLPAEFLCNLPKNLTMHLTHKFCLVLPLLFYRLWYNKCKF